MSALFAGAPVAFGAHSQIRRLDHTLKMPGTAQNKAPARMGKLFSQMLVDCPLDIQVYGACVANLTGGVDRFACDKEFSKLRECFQRAAKKKGALRT